jgi:hypothetical protein
MRKRLKEAESREGMSQIAAFVPDEMHRTLARLRADERISIGQAVREALAMWLASRKRRKGGRS